MKAQVRDCFQILFCLMIAVAVIADAAWADRPADVEQPIDFVRDVQPILREQCYECHTTGNEEGGLHLGVRSRAMEGGNRGAAIEPGSSESSLLIHLVSGLDSDRKMPPDGEGLTARQIEILKAWIDQGAHWPTSADIVDARLERSRQHWAFQPLRPVEPPTEIENPWIRTPVDSFISQHHRARALPHSMPLAPAALARRLSFNLVGLPPTQEQIAQLLEDGSIAELIDQLLDSPHYGERWGRHWLDVARFAESDGQESDKDRPHAYLFRDFVIQAFNQDMPFDQFVRWQIAGDEITPESNEAIIATGFLTSGTHSELGADFIEEEKLFNRYNELDDVVSTVGSGLLGLSLACARCHDHKYDAISSREYYQLLSAFHSGDRVETKLPDGRSALVFKDFDQTPRTTWYFRRADFYDRQQEVALGFPSILTVNSDAELYWSQARLLRPEPASTLQRLALANWLVDVEQGAGPLLARVIVNRIWQHHFGQGLVRTPSDFGVRGDPPTHPELLEYLANDFVRHGWSIKRLHRLILNSSVWQQGHQIVHDDSLSGDPRTIDPDNRYLWKMNPQRLEAEIIRDSMLAASGTLNPQPGGPSFKPHIPREANLARNLKGEKYPTDVPDGPDVRRRSVYMFHKRLLPYPMLQAFDRPDLLVSCAARQNTVVAPQALAILNDAAVRQFARDFARRLQTEVVSLQTNVVDSDDLDSNALTTSLKDTGQEDEQLQNTITNATWLKMVARRSFEIALSRAPTELELDLAVQFLNQQTTQRQSRSQSAESSLQDALTDFCQVLFGLNEFIYID